MRGHYNAGVGIGLYSEGVGIITALSQGLEGKFRERILAALRIDKDYLDGAPQVVWGRYFFKLPWPKRDVGQATKVLTEAVRTHPNNARAKLYLADCYSDSDRLDEGTKLVHQILSAPPGSDLPEDRRLRKKATRRSRAPTASWASISSAMAAKSPTVPVAVPHRSFTFRCFRS